jgi:D-serine deaminase-like pyridoxal phosphate-dependent protein
VDVGLHRTGVQTPAEALALARHISRDGRRAASTVLSSTPATSAGPQRRRDASSPRWTRSSPKSSIVAADGLEAKIVSGGSDADRAPVAPRPPDDRVPPGTYVYHDMNGVRGGYASFDDCAARSSPPWSARRAGQVVIDAGSKTLTMDRCGPAPDSGHGTSSNTPRRRSSS